MNVKASSQDVSRHKLNGTDHAKGSFGSGYRIRTLLLTLLAFHMFALVAALTFMTFRQYKDEVAEKRI